MIDFKNISSEEFNELKSIASKIVEKSEFERIFLYSQDVSEKGKLFLFCHRFLVGIYNLISEGDVKNELKNIITSTQDIYMRIAYLGTIKSEFDKSKRNREVLLLVERDEAREIIDFFSLLVERINLIKMSRFKGILLEGKSGEEYKKLFPSEYKRI